MNLLTKLSNLKKELEREKIELAKIDGRMSQLKDRLASDFNIDDHQEVQNVIDNLSARISKQQRIASKAIGEIEELEEESR